MSECAYCGKREDYTDQYAVPYSPQIIVAACLDCFKKIEAKVPIKPIKEPLLQLQFDFMEQPKVTWLWKEWYGEK